MKLLDLSATATGCEHFGLLLASRQESSFLGLVGLLMDSSPDLESAFKKSILSHSIHAQGARWQLSTEGEYASASLTFDAPVSINPRQAIELAVGQAFQIVRTLGKGRWQPKKICFRHQRPRDDGYYKHCFGVPVVFDSEFDGFYFSSSDLELPVPGKDERVHSALSEYADILTRDDKQNLCERIKVAIRKLLLDESLHREFGRCIKRHVGRGGLGCGGCDVNDLFCCTAVFHEGNKRCRRKRPCCRLPADDG